MRIIPRICPKVNNGGYLQFCDITIQRKLLKNNPADCGASNIDLLLVIVEISGVNYQENGVNVACGTCVPIPFSFVLPFQCEAV